MEDDDIPTAAPSDWQPITNSVDLAVLGKLGEEVGELTSAISRCLIQGMDGIDPDTGKINSAALEDEIADVKALMLAAVQRFQLNTERIDVRRKRKYNFKLAWFKNLAKRHKDSWP
jgi:NTP pyrophosphatase (non-canonical NTP hydrolase)